MTPLTHRSFELDLISPAYSTSFSGTRFAAVDSGFFSFLNPSRQSFPSNQGPFFFFFGVVSSPFSAPPPPPPWTEPFASLRT